MFIKVEETPNPNTLKFIPEKSLDLDNTLHNNVQIDRQLFKQSGGKEIVIIKTYQFSEQRRYHCVLSPFAVKFCEITQ